MQRKRIVVAGCLMLCFGLAGCRQELQIQQQRPGGLGTATRGIEVKGPQAETATVPGVVGTTLPLGVEPGAATTAPAEVQTLPAEPPPVAAAPPTTPTVNPALANVQLPVPADLGERWRQMQEERTVFEGHRTFVSTGSHTVWWFDPIFGQFLPLGEVQGAFTVQARFRLKGQWIEALELPYHVNQQYNIDIPPVILERMRNAGVGEWTEVFVYRTRDMNEK